MAERFFLETPPSGMHAVLTGVEAHHLINVMRAKPGDRVTLFDGSGAEFLAEVQSVRRGTATLNITERREVDRELPLPITLGVALPKGDRQKWLIEKAVELGVAAVVPLQTEHAVVQPSSESIVRLRRAVIEASKQCGRNRLMRIEAPQTWMEYMVSTGSTETRLIAHPATPGADHESPGGREKGCPLDIRSQVALAIGPEGGLTEEEVATALQRGWMQVDLGRRILRIETAAILLVAMVAVARK